MLIKKTKIRESRDIFLLFLLFFSTNVALMAPIVFYGVNIFLYILLCISMFLIRFEFSKKMYFLILIFSLVFTSLIFIQSTYLYYGRYIFDLSFFSIVMGIFCLLTFEFIRNTSTEIIVKTLKYSIYIFAIPIILQYVYVYVFGGNPSLVDISTYLGGDVSRSMGVGDVEEKSLIFRPTGFTSEPAISSGVISSLCALYYLGEKNKQLPIVIGVSGMILSMSTLGILLAVIISSLCFVDSLKKLFVFMCGAIVSSGFIFILLFERFTRFESGNDGSNNAKLEVIKYYFSDLGIILFGFLTPNTSIFTPPDFFHALGDLGFVFNAIGRYGLIVGGLVIAIIIIGLLKTKTTLREKILLFLGVLKLNILAPFFIIMVIVVGKISNERK